MQARGYSLVEVSVVIGIISLLLVLATPRFADLLRRYRTEAQTRMIFSELLQARANALYLRREVRLKFFPERFEVYSSAADGATVAPVVVQLLHYPIDLDGAVSIDFDERGIALDQRAICLAGAETTGTVDSVVIAKTRLSIGKKDLGDACKSENITKR